MAISFDGANKLIVLSTGTVTLGVRDLWSRWIDWVSQSDNSKYPPAFRTVGGDETDPGTFIPIYAYLLNGWKIRPQSADHTLEVNDGILRVEGGGDPFVNPIGSFVVRIKYQQPVQAITVSTSGSSGPTPESIANAVVAALQATRIPVNVKQVNDVVLQGAGVPGNSMRPA